MTDMDFYTRYILTCIYRGLMMMLLVFPPRQLLKAV